jgi:hypothetical protein
MKTPANILKPAEEIIVFRIYQVDGIVYRFGSATPIQTANIPCLTW